MNPVALRNGGFTRCGSMPMTESMFEREVEQGAPGAWWLFVLTSSAWLVISLLVFELAA